MKFATQLLNRALLITTPIVASCTIAIAPSHAATFASSFAGLLLFNEEAATNLLTDTDTNTIAFTPSGTVTLNADAESDGFFDPVDIAQISAAQAEGDGTNYRGVADSFSEAIADVTTDGWFQFDFEAILASLTSVTDPAAGEVARAESTIGFQVFDNANPDRILDSFSITGFSSSNRTGRLTINQTSPFISFTSFLQEESPGLAGAAFQGVYARQFAPSTSVRVRSFTRTSAAVAVPEPQFVLTLFAVPAFVGIRVVRSKMKQRRIK